MTLKQLKGKTFPFVITREDYLNSTKEFGDDKNCPFATAFKRQFPKVKGIYVGVRGVYKNSVDLVDIACLKESFLHEDYLRLKRYGKHHKTSIYFYE